MSIKDQIGSCKISNLGGTRASKGFSYQNHWSIKKLIDLQQSGKDYVMFFEVYDDISVLDSEADPKKIGIYQVKSSQHQSPITIAHLCRKENGKPSILAKLLLTKKGLPPELCNVVDGLYIVSNSAYKCDTKFHSSATTQVSVSNHYSTVVKKKIKDLSSQTGLQDTEVQDLLEITFLIKSPLSYDEPERQIRDILQEFFKKHFENFDFDIVPFYQQLLIEIENKSNAEKIDGYEDTLKSKSITKRWFEEVLANISPGTKHQLKVIIDDLRTEGWTADKIISLERAWKQMEIDNLSDKEYHNGKILEAIEKLILKFESKNQKYSDATETVLNELKARHTSACNGKTDYYIRALILWRTLNYRLKVLEN